MNNEEIDSYRQIDQEKLENYMKIILIGLPTAMAVLFGQLVLTWNYWLLGGFVASSIIFFIITYFYITKKIPVPL